LRSKYGMLVMPKLGGG